MKNLKKIGALVLALMLVMSLMSVAFADPENFNTGNGTDAGQALGDGEVGGFTSGHPDEWRALAKSINIQKEITAYNPDEAYVYGPAITYTYAIAAASGSELVTITDAAADHASGVATTTTALAGVTTGVTMNGTSANTIAWTNADILDASAAGAKNVKYLTVDFSSVVFPNPGVYRYVITETATYDETGVTNGDILATRYLDVYVKRSATFTEDNSGSVGQSDPTYHANSASDWTIYGYVCISPESVTNDEGGETNVTPSTVKTDGFVNDGTNSADEYYTYNFTITKDLVGDDTMIRHQFPMNVAFAGPTGTFQLIAETDGTYSSLTTTTVASGAATVNTTTGITGATATSAQLLKVGGADTLANFANAGNPKVADGNATTGATTGFIKYIGIPNTTVVTVTETNDLIGTTYTASVYEDVTTDDASALTQVNMTSTNGLTGTLNGFDVASIDYNEYATRTAASNGGADALAKNVDIQFKNELSLISPTGYVVRIAPYALILMFGIGLIVLLAVRRRKEQEEA